jgi:hypothetical protein
MGAQSPAEDRRYAESSRSFNRGSRPRGRWP